LWAVTSFYVSKYSIFGDVAQEGSALKKEQSQQLMLAQCFGIGAFG